MIERRPAHDPVAAAVRQRPEVVADARRGVGPPARADRRQRRRRAPRPHVRRAVHHVVPRRHVARPPARLARALRATDDASARTSSSACASAASSARAFTPTSSLFDPATGRTGEVRLVDDLPGGTARLFADAIGVQPRDGERHDDRRTTARRPARFPARCCAPAATPTPSRFPRTSERVFVPKRPLWGRFRHKHSGHENDGMTCLPMRSMVCMTCSWVILYGFTRQSSRSTPAAS